MIKQTVLDLQFLILNDFHDLPTAMLRLLLMLMMRMLDAGDDDIDNIHDEKSVAARDSSTQAFYSILYTVLP